MRELPPTKLIKSGDHTPDFSSYLVVTAHDHMHLGEVYRPSGSATWTACVKATRPGYGEGVRVVGHRITRARAVERVVEAWLAPIDEVEAYHIVSAVQSGTQRAEEDAAKQLASNPSRRLVPDAFTETRPFSAGTRVVTENLDMYRQDLAERLAGRRPCESYYLRYSAYMVRMSELELARREKGVLGVLTPSDELIPSGDYSEDEQAPYSPTWLWWDRRIAEIAEQLGQAQAHAIRRPDLQYKRVDDGELMEETVFAKRSLERQRKRNHLDVDALRTAAFSYQLMLNASHERALQEER
jgi:hypothetical protein